MKSLNVIQALSKIGKVLSKIAFIFSVVGFCGGIAGLLNIGFGGGGLIKLGGVTLHGLLSEKHGYDTGSAAATLSGWLVVCAGEAVLAKFAEDYFKNELEAETPFTFAGARKLLRLGILTLVVPAGCAVAGSVVRGIVSGFTGASKAVAADMLFGGEAGVVLGAIFILGSLLCRYGAELKENRGL